MSGDQTGVFLSMQQAYSIARDMLGPEAKVLNYDGRLHQVGNDPNKRCWVGLGGVGRSNVEYGTGPTWAEALRNAGLL